MAEARKKILCIEDDRATARLIAEQLLERGFYPLIAYESHVGLAAMLRKSPDLVLCDVGLPEMSGFEVLRRWKELSHPFNRIPFIFLTGFADRRSELEGRTLGADDYVTKPIDFDILEAVIRARLVGGVVRHEISTSPPKAGESCVELPVERAYRRAWTKKNVKQIIELIDAPPVDFYLQNSNSIAGTTFQTEIAAKAINDRLIKP